MSETREALESGVAYMNALNKGAVEFLTGKWSQQGFIDHCLRLSDGPERREWAVKINRALAALSDERGEERGWMPIETAPKDGTHILAWSVTIVDEYDEADRIVRRGVREECAYIVYWVFGGFAPMPWNGGLATNVTYTHWQPLPAPPASIRAGGDNG